MPVKSGWVSVTLWGAAGDAFGRDSELHAPEARGRAANSVLSSAAGQCCSAALPAGMVCAVMLRHGGRAALLISPEKLFWSGKKTQP